MRIIGWIACLFLAYSFLYNGMESAPAATDCVLTVDKFSSVKMKMSYEEVTKVLGCEGKVLSETELVGTKSGMYIWSSTHGFKSVSGMFQNDRLFSKNQFGLQ